MQELREEDVLYVCYPCREMKPRYTGEIIVPGGNAGKVWCPWCGDAMEQYHPKHHGESVLMTAEESR